LRSLVHFESSIVVWMCRCWQRVVSIELRFTDQFALIVNKGVFMSQNLESDFLKAARKLKQKNRKVLRQRIGTFSLISAMVAGLVYLLFKDDSPFRIGSIDVSSKILLLSILGLVLILSSVIYFI